MKPRISVVVPTYREEKRIGMCLRSIRSQSSRGPIEVIVVDSHSQDATRSVATTYADKVIDIKRRGVGRARNAGAKAAAGDVILFVDADTVLMPDFVEEVDRAFGEDGLVGATGKISVLEIMGPVDTLFARVHYGMLNAISWASSLARRPLFPTVCCACRKTVFEKVGGFEEDLAVAEDITLSLKLGRAGKCRLVKSAVARTSARRLLRFGKLKTYSMYFRNYFRFFVLKRRPWIEEFPHID